MQICDGPPDGACGALVTCVVCEHCEDHCLTGGSGRCAMASWPSAAVAEAMDALARENGLVACRSCEGLEDPTSSPPMSNQADVDRR
jgi:hypothetical protein